MHNDDWDANKTVKENFVTKEKNIKFNYFVCIISIIQ